MKQLLLLFAFLLTTQCLLAQMFTEIPPPSDFAGVNTGTLNFADIDSDGDQDVLITGLLEGGVRSAKLYANDGTGSYTEVSDTPFDPVYNSAVAFGDVDNDGDMDLVITGDNGQELITKLYLNDGTGSFTEQLTSLFTGIANGAVAFADVDNDGDPDLLISGFDNAVDRTVNLYLNDGDGSFTETLDTPFVNVGLSALAFADVDNDGDLDVLIMGGVGGIEGSAELYVNDGMGSFTEAADTPFTGLYEGGVAFSDVDGDGDQDVLITGRRDFGIVATLLYENDGTGHFTEVADTPFINLGRSALAFADIDDDGDEDVLLTGEDTFGGTRLTKMYTNDGAGGFTEVPDFNLPGVVLGKVAFADVDGDGDSDVLVTGRDEDFVRNANLYFNDGAGNYPFVMPLPFRALVGEVAFSDVDGDGDEDLLLAGFITSGARVTALYDNDGTGVFTEVVDAPFDAVTAGALAFADVDGDGDEDVLITGTNGDERTAKLYTNDGTGIFTEVPDTPFPGVTVSALAFADIDGDGDNDLLLAGAPSPGPEIAKLYVNDGVGNFTEVPETPFATLQVYALAFSDIDGDNDNDLLIVGRENTGPPFSLVANLYTNDGTGNFTELANTPFSGTNASTITFVDVDGDTDPDVLITGSTSPDTEIADLFLNDGTGNYSAAIDTPFDGVRSGAVAVADVEGDGDNDLVITGTNNSMERIAKLYLNDGDGNYLEYVDTPFAGVASGALAFSDIDGDGDKDLLITGTDNDAERVTKLYRNESDFTSGVNDQAVLDFDFVAFPNPSPAAQVYIRCHVPEQTELTVRIFDVNGHLLCSEKQNVSGSPFTFSIDLTGYLSGTYFLTLEDGIRRGAASVIVQ